MSNEAISENDKIQILLHEYGTLRTEILQRSNNILQFLAACVVVLGGLGAWLVSHADDRRSWLFCAVAIVFILVIFPVSPYLYQIMIGRRIDDAAGKLRGLEKEINDRAGAQLLQWETHFSGGARGHWGWRRPRPLPHQKPH